MQMMVSQVLTPLSCVAFALCAAQVPAAPRTSAASASVTAERPAVRDGISAHGLHGIAYGLVTIQISDQSYL